MLVLSRKSGEEIIMKIPPCDVEQVVTVRVVEVRGDKTRLGIEAEGWVKVHRKEVQDAIDRGEVPKRQDGTVVRLAQQ